ncbi:hypothetical protein IWQ62_004037 [Dispira parvispora]|uniref:RNA-binding S4 domain-containing protein n=1 Tax=Dispira parvispora TaxID=1520584 RepID=A0A9W8AQM5_9FUNG|nr:hypothetical protein IWQ62_004037 [Dispira parvispora]
MFKPRLPTLNVQLLNVRKASLRKLFAPGSKSVAEMVAQEREKANREHPSAASLMYAPMERRVDFILFRSHFVSSIYMARQVIRTGNVTVNGEKVKIPSFSVADGDVVQIDPSAVCTLEGKASDAMTFKARPFMQPWMFIPDYLEVNYNTCSTVFLREPITRPNRTEIPSPFPPQVHSLAYEFYVNKSRSYH